MVPPAILSPAALADGDPASDVLVYDQLFNPPDSGLSSSQYAQLQAIVKAANQAGYPLKVALVASAADLGTVTQLWGDPRDYSQYLGRELSLQFHGNLLVVMPQGYGLYLPVAAKQIPPGDIKAMADLVQPGSQLAVGAATVIGRLTADNNINLPSHLAATATASGSGSSISGLELGGLIAGLVAVTAAWAISLRRRPIRTKVAT